MEHFGTLPEPVDAVCLVQSLARPLSVVATSSDTSVQPADGPERPRLFILSGALTLALGTRSGLDDLELSEQVDEMQTRKAELALPIEDATVEDAFANVMHEEYGTSCALCHEPQGDEPDPETISIGLRPEPDTLIPVDELAKSSRFCRDPGCALLDALLDGEVVDGAFPQQWMTLDEVQQ